MVARERIGSTSGHVCWGFVRQQRVVSGETVPPVPGTGQGPFMGRDPVKPGSNNLVFWRENNGYILFVPYEVSPGSRAIDQGFPDKHRSWAWKLVSLLLELKLLNLKPSLQTLIPKAPISWYLSFMIAHKRICNTRVMFLTRTWVVKRLQFDKKNTVDLSVGL